MSDNSSLWSYVIVFAVGYILGHSGAFKAGKRLGSRQGFAAGRGRKDCFVATAAAGSSDAPEVRVLRRFRDEILLNTEAGIRMARFYYRIGPAMARFIEYRPLLRRTVLMVLIRPASKIAIKFLKKSNN